MSKTTKVDAPVLRVKGDKAFRGARAEWYKVLVAHDGKTPEAFLAACTANPPTLPTKGKSAGKAEPPAGWLRWFIRNGVAELQPSK